MMVPKKSLFLAGAALAIGVSAGAQSQSGKVFARYNKPLKSASLDLATGTVTRGPALNNRAGTTVADFSNIDLGGFIGVDTGGGACEWIDAGTKGVIPNASDLMNNVVFAYCSVIADPASGGPGGSVLMGFFEGYAAGGPAPTTAVALFNLTGLPGHTGNSSFIALVNGAGGTTCYFLNLIFANCISFADGNIGYSWGFTDLGTTSVLAATFPFLSCVQSCSGTGPDNQGMVDTIDQYCPPGGAVNTFSFGTTPFGSYFTSISMDVREVADAEAVATSWNSQNINSDILSAAAIVIGSNWQVNILIAGHSHGASGPTNVKVRGTCINGPNLNSPTGHPVEVLTSGPINLTLADAHNGTVTSYNPFAVPCDITLVGLGWAAQGTVVGGGRADLTRARCGLVGSVNLNPDP
jgi:hypothetical protein